MNEILRISAGCTSNLSDYELFQAYRRLADTIIAGPDSGLADRIASAEWKLFHHVEARLKKPGCDPCQTTAVWIRHERDRSIWRQALRASLADEMAILVPADVACVVGCPL